jgi:hypothetical protein
MCQLAVPSPLLNSMSQLASATQWHNGSGYCSIVQLGSLCSLLTNAPFVPLFASSLCSFVNSETMEQSLGYCLFISPWIAFVNSETMEQCAHSFPIHQSMNSLTMEQRAHSLPIHQSMNSLTMQQCAHSSPAIHQSMNSLHPTKGQWNNVPIQHCLFISSLNSNKGTMEQCAHSSLPIHQLPE